jgi:hypothetical protein
MSKFRFQRWKQTITLLFATNNTIISVSNVQLNGLLSATIVKTPAAVDSAATVAVTIVDESGLAVFSRSGLAVNTNTQAILTGDTKVPLGGIYTVTVTFSAAQTANRDTDVTLLIDRGA